MNTSPACNFARRILSKYSLELPIDVEKIIRDYAELSFVEIPIEGIDGISLNLKMSGKLTRVIVNENNHPLRKRFTLAHELGHIIIPWHTGNIVDSLDLIFNHGSEKYWEIEQEANLFASELLMPECHIKSTLKDEKDLAKAHGVIAETCNVSLQAAAVRLTNYLPGNIVFAIEKSGVIEFAGRTEGTLAPSLTKGSSFDSKVYDYHDEAYSLVCRGKRLHWWKLPQSVEMSFDDNRDWREILNTIVEAMGLSGQDAVDFKRSVNGVVAYANSRVKRQVHYSIETLLAACMQRFNDRSEFEFFVNHSDFEVFLYKKSLSLIAQ